MINKRRTELKTIVEDRASIILYNILKYHSFKGIFLLPANVCPVVPATFYKAGIDFEFVDINPDTLCLDENTVFTKLKSNNSIAGLLFVRTFGTTVSFTQFFERIKSQYPSLFVIDDRCISPPLLPEEFVPEAVNVTLFSTGYSKFVELGFGGFAFIPDDENYTPLQLPFDSLAHDNLQDQFRVALKDGAFNYTESDWLGDASKVLDAKEYFNSIEKKRIEAITQKTNLNQIYKATIPKKFQMDSQFENWRLNILVNNKNVVLDKIFDAGLFASSHYASLAGIFGPGTGINANRLHEKIINLFNDFRFTEKDAQRVGEIVTKYAQ